MEYVNFTGEYHSPRNFGAFRMGGSAGKRVLLIVSGGIAAYKTPDLVRRLRGRGLETRVILTDGGANLVSPLALQTVSGHRVYRDMWALIEESEIGHIELARGSDVVLVAPATAHVIARAALGLADDLATTALLATDRPILMAPAMNPRMWNHPATRGHLATLAARGVRFVGPDEGAMACGEFGPGRMSEPEVIADAVVALLDEIDGPKPLSGTRALVTSGPTREPIDPVRHIANLSSGKQGHAIARALARLGAEVTLVSGPATIPDPEGVRVVHVETALEMLAACRAALPADIGVFAAAVADWRVKNAATLKLKKDGGAPPVLELVENPDILATISRLSDGRRPCLVVGFAAETGDVMEKAVDKRVRKGCDWIVANDVSPGTGTFGGDHNTVFLIKEATIDPWPTLTKEATAERLATEIANRLSEATS